MCISTSEFCVKIPNAILSSLEHLFPLCWPHTAPYDTLMDDLYPTDADLRQFYIASKKETVFYSLGASPSEAEKFARTQDKRFYLNCWPPRYLNKRSKNRWRYRAFVESFSRVLAQEATGMVWVVAPPLLGNPRQCLQPRNKRFESNKSCRPCRKILRSLKFSRWAVKQRKTPVVVAYRREFLISS